MLRSAPTRIALKEEDLKELDAVSAKDKTAGAASNASAATAVTPPVVRSVAERIGLPAAT
jgi:hypothetical protein